MASVIGKLEDISKHLSLAELHIETIGKDLENSNFFIRYHAKTEPRLRIICFPYAGGTASIYRGWVESLPEHVEVLAIQLPGRSTNISQPPYSDMMALVDDMLGRLRNEIDLPYVLFGHSLGSRVAFEMLHKFYQEGLPLPQRFIASGSRPPHFVRSRRLQHSLSDSQLINLIKSLNGTPQEVIENEELMRLYLPMLRADFKISQSYQCSFKVIFPCPITVFGGNRDLGVSFQDLEGWGHFFSHTVDIRVISGEHFFIDKQKAEFLGELRMIIASILETIQLKQG